METEHKLTLGKFGEIVRAMAELAALVLLFMHFFEIAKKEEVELIGFYIVTTLFSIVILVKAIIAWRKIKLHRKANIASALPIINDAFTRIHTTLGNNASTASDYLKAFRHFCNRLSEAFHEITGTYCHVSIKISSSATDANGNTIYSAEAIARERKKVLNHSEPVRSFYDKGATHLYSENTDFEEIFFNSKNNRERFFICNNIPKRAKKGQYQNSSFKNFSLPITGPPKRPWPWREEFWVNGQWKIWRRRVWPLAYRSTIVAPIFPSLSDPTPQDTIAGFLCIDCRETRMFRKEEDIPLLIGCANGLFNAIKEYDKKSKAG